MDIVITLPKSISWKDYEKELELVEDGSSVLNFKVPHLPKKTNIGDRCYLCYKGYVIGWMEIVGMRDNDFVCSVTGRYWDGKFVQRSGKFNRIEPIPMKGFQGYRYFNQ